jgi:RHS repeat-associated protein
MPTKYTYTGQYSNMSDFGLMFYNARWYDPALGRFAQADSIIPQQQGVQAWDRYAYVNNNPVRYTDPSGHCIFCDMLLGVAIPYALSLMLNPSPATSQAVSLVTEWAKGTGDEIRIFGPEQPITQEIVQQSGVDDFRDAWAESGYADDFSTRTEIEDDRSNLANWAGTFVHSHFVDLPLSLLGVEGHSAIPGTIGSLDRIYANYTEDGRVMIMVQNTMGTKSLFRVGDWDGFPNLDWSGPFGTKVQYFYWYEDVPIEQDEGEEEMR